MPMLIAIGPQLCEAFGQLLNACGGRVPPNLVSRQFTDGRGHLCHHAVILLQHSRGR
jgi:hypothetical protein